MATFTTDQARQFYVVLSKQSTVTSASTLGSTKVVNGVEDVFIQHKSPNSDIPVRSDLIPKSNVLYAKAVKGKVRNLTRYSIAFDSTVNSGAPIAGQEYFVRIEYDYLGTYDHRTYEYGSYLAKTGDNAAAVLTGIVASLNKNATANPKRFITASVVGSTIIIQEIEPQWILGKMQSRPLVFRVITGTVTTSTGDNVIWGTVTNTTSTNTSNTVGNGKITADMEYFYYGERADIYRNISWPNSFDNKYIVDPTKQYDFVEICYFYAGDTEDTQRSKKMITLAVPTDSSYTIDDLAEDLTTAGISVDVSALPVTP